MSPIIGALGAGAGVANCASYRDMILAEDDLAVYLRLGSDGGADPTETFGSCSAIPGAIDVTSDPTATGIISPDSNEEGDSAMECLGSGYRSTALSTCLYDPEDFTIEGWINEWSASRANDAFMFVYGQFGRFTRCAVVLKQADGTVEFRSTDTNSTSTKLGAVSSMSLRDSGKYHIVARYRNSDDLNDLWINGVEVDSNVIAGTGMHDGGGSGDYFSVNGYISSLGTGFAPNFGAECIFDEVALYHRRLSDQDILRHYNAGICGL